MLALSYDRPFHVSVKKKPDPRIEHPQDVVLKVTRAAICGSDLHLLHGLIADTRVGHTFGHEFTGVVEELGPEVRTLQRGDRVVVPFNISCGGCYYCERGLFACCERSNPNTDLVGGVFGYSHTTGGYDGAQAEYVRVPYADVGPLRIPDDLDDDQALFLGDILPTGYQGAEMAGLAGGETVVIFGCGPVGLFAAKSAWMMGAERVIMVDQVPERLAFARTYCAVETVDFSEHLPDPVPYLRELTGGRGPDACIDAVGMEAAGSKLHRVMGMLKLESGAPTALNWAIQTVRRAGTVSIIGVYGPPFNLIPIGVAMNKGLTLRMNQCNVRRYMPHLLQRIQEGALDPTRIITHRFPLKDAPHAYQLFSDKEDGCIKCVLMPQAQA
jgi:threonine dehydrogenase-like Zn-dependent dehydrogenase